MRESTDKVDPYRITTGKFSSRDGSGIEGAYRIKMKGTIFFIMCGAAYGWEHVSVSNKARCPTWEEMCFVKDLFWKQSEAVVQFHAPKKENINLHPFCLHLWRPINYAIILPPTILIG